MLATGRFSSARFEYKGFPVLASITMAALPTMLGAGVLGRMTLNALAALRFAVKIDLPADLFDCALAIGAKISVKIIDNRGKFLEMYTVNIKSF